MPILNIFAFGTREHSAEYQKKDSPNKKDEEYMRNLISYFSEHCNGNKYNIEGPNVLGTDVNNNVLDTCNYIKWVILENKLKEPLNVNMLGYSRGATTLLAIANHFKEHPNWNVHFNIMAIDPVAGPGWKGQERFRRIPPNVVNYVSCLQLHEPRSFFKSQSLKRMVVEDRKKTRAVFLPFPGNHPAPIRASAYKELNHTAQAVHYIAYDFLHKLGTQFKDDKMPPLAFKTKDNKCIGIPHEQADYYGTEKSEQELLELFAEMKLRESEYQAMMGNSVVKTFPKSLEEYTSNSDYFINQFHSNLFKKHYPHVFDYLFQKRQEAQQPVEQKEEGSAREQEFAQLRTHNPKLAATLESRRGNTLSIQLGRLEKELIQEMRFYQREDRFLGRRKAKHHDADRVVAFIIGEAQKQNTEKNKIEAIQVHLSGLAAAEQNASFLFHLQRMSAHCQHALDPLSPAVALLPRKSKPRTNESSRLLLWLAIGAVIFCSLYFTGGLAAIPYLGWLVTQIGSAANPLFSAVFGFIAKKLWEFGTWLVKFCRPDKEKREEGSVEEKAGLLSDEKQKSEDNSNLDALNKYTSAAYVHDALAQHPPEPFIAPTIHASTLPESASNLDTHSDAASAATPGHQHYDASEVTTAPTVGAGYHS